MTQKRERKNSLAAAVPAAGISALSSLPKGFLDEAVQTSSYRAMTGRKPLLTRSQAWQALRGRGLGRAVGASTSFVTFPLLVSGISDLRSSDPKKRKKGAAKVLLSSAAYGTMKGGIEETLAALSKKSRPSEKQLRRIVTSVAGTRGVLGMGSGFLLAKAVAGNQKKSKPSTTRSAAFGATIGFGKGLIEEGLTNKRHLLRGGARRSVALRRVAAGGLGRAASGAFGAIVLDRLAGTLMKKQSSLLKEVGGNIRQLGYKARAAVHPSPPKVKPPPSLNPLDWMDAYPGVTLPFAGGVIAAGLTGRSKLQRLREERNYAEAMQTGRYPGVGVVR